MKRSYHILLLVLCAVLMLESALAASGTDAQSRIEALLNAMTLDQKISQMIMPALRTWDSEKVTELSVDSALAEALRRHQYGGVILFGQNIASTEQTLRLIDDLQRNNALGVPEAIPYLVSADQEGGSVARLSMGTRGTGSMAIGATGEAAEGNARAIGQVFGEELEALGINVNLGPCIDAVKRRSPRAKTSKKEKTAAQKPSVKAVETAVEGAKVAEEGITNLPAVPDDAIYNSILAGRDRDELINALETFIAKQKRIHRPRSAQIAFLKWLNETAFSAPTLQTDPDIDAKLASKQA